jgi:hypothetical protein
MKLPLPLCQCATARRLSDAAAPPPQNLFSRERRGWLLGFGVERTSGSQASRRLRWLIPCTKVVNFNGPPFLQLPRYLPPLPHSPAQCVQVHLLHLVLKVRPSRASPMEAPILGTWSLRGAQQHCKFRTPSEGGCLLGQWSHSDSQLLEGTIHALIQDSMWSCGHVADFHWSNR